MGDKKAFLVTFPANPQSNYVTVETDSLAGQVVWMSILNGSFAVEMVGFHTLQSPFGLDNGTTVQAIVDTMPEEFRKRVKVVKGKLVPAYLPSKPL